MTVVQTNQWDYLLARYHSADNFSQRQSLYRTFIEQSWPTRRSKRFRFVDFKELQSVNWQWPAAPSNPDVLDGYAHPDNTWVYALVDGEPLGWVAQPEGETVCPIDASIEPIHCNETKADDLWRLLNGIWSTGRLLMSVKPHSVLKHPICILHYNTSSSKPVTTQWQHHLEVGEGAEAQVMMSFAGATDSMHWMNIHWLVQVGQQANLILSNTCLPNAAHYHTHNLVIEQSAQSHCHVLLGHVNAHWGFHDVNCHMLGSGAHVSIQTLAAMRDQQQWSQLIQMHHQASYTSSSVQSRSLLDNRSCHHLNIHSHILPKVIGASATQNHRSLLLSDHAHVRSEPMLEIANDDVSCAHGSTVSQLNPNDLFYLQSRGLPYTVARSMLAEAFVGSLLSEKVSVSARDQLMQAFKGLNWGDK